MNDIMQAIDTTITQEIAASSEKILADAGIVFQESRTFMTNEPPPFDWIIQGICAKGMKGDLNAKSKQWKSFLGIQCAVCIATGRPFLNMHVPQARKVAYFNLELMDRGVWERTQTMEKSLEANPEQGMLYFVNLRGRAKELRNHGQELVTEVTKRGIDFVVLDPRYKLISCGEDENNALGLQGVLEFRDTLAKAAAVLMIGHDPKGDTAGKSMADRGAGSYTAGADYDFSFALSPHELDGHSVLSTSCRYRKSPSDLTIRFDSERQVFEAMDDILPAVRQPKRGSGGINANPKDKAKQEQMKYYEFEKAVRQFVAKNQLMDKGTFDIEISKLPEAQAIGGEKKRDKAIRSLLDRGIIAQTDKWEKAPDGTKKMLGGKHYLVGSPEKVKEYADAFNTLDR